MEKNIKILLIEDNSGDAYLIEEHLEEFANFSYELKNVGTLKEGLNILKEQTFDVIMSDLFCLIAMESTLFSEFTMKLR